MAAEPFRRTILAAVAVFLGCCPLGDAPPTSEAPIPGNTRIESFRRAKKLLERNVFHDHRTTLYCACSYDGRKVVDWTSCGYTPKSDRRRAARVEWEHVVPAYAFGQSFREWGEGHRDCVDRKGKAFKRRKCARKVSKEFRQMEADMYNLQPAVGEVNRDRSHFSMAEIAGEERAYGACDVEIAGRKFEPRPAVRGEIARTYMYMHRAYPGRGIISGKNWTLFEAWDRADPVDRWECERARRIEFVQENKNEVVEEACLRAGL